MTAQELSLVKKYAQAFNTTFGPHLSLDQVAQVERLVSVFKEHKNSLFYLKLTFMPAHEVKNMLNKVLHEYDVHESYTTLVATLVDAKYSYLLPAVLEYSVRLYKVQHNLLDIVIASSHELTENQLANVRAFVEHATHKKVLYKTVIDKRLIAGIKVYSDALYWEHSVRRQLRALSNFKK